MANKGRAKYWELLLVVLGAVLAVIFPEILPKVWAVLSHAVSWAWGMLTAYYLVPGWTLLIFIGLALLIPIGAFILLWMSRGSSEEDADDVEGYTSDEIFGVRWEWAWSYGEVVAIEGICPVCACTLTDEQGSIFDSKPIVNFFCQYCSEVKTSVPGVYLSNAHSVISREVIRRLRLKKQAKMADH